MKWYLYLAMKQLFPSGRKLSFFSSMSIFGVALGVMVLLVVQSVMEGFQQNIKDAIVQTQGDIRIDSQNIIYDSDQLISLLGQFNEVESAAKFAYGAVMLRHNNRPTFPILKGIDLKNELKVIGLKNFIKSGNLENFDTDHIIISSELAAQIHASVGSSVDVYSPIMIENATIDDVILPKTLEVSAIYETGYHQADKNIAIVSLDTMQDLYGLEDGIHGISVKLKSKAKAEKFAYELNKHLDFPITATSWQAMNEDFLFALKTEKTMMFFVLIFILIIAAFSIASSLTIAVVRKTREIGLISALGGTTKQCAICFMLQGLIIGIFGSALGVALGMLVLSIRNSIIAVFVKLCGVEDFMTKFYSFADLPAKYCLSDIFVIASFAIFICCAAGILPAIKASKIKPAEALRNE